MTDGLDAQVRRALQDRIRYYNDLGIYDFYRRPVEKTEPVVTATLSTIPDQTETPTEMPRTRMAATSENPSDRV